MPAMAGWHAASAVAGRRRAGGVDQRPVVLDQARQRRLGQVEAVEGRVSAIKLGDDAERVGIVIEAAMSLHAGVERVLAGMAEGRMAEVVGKRDRLGEVVVDPERPRQRPGDLRHFDAVGEAGAKMVSVVGDKDLGLVGEPPKRRGVDDAVPIALELASRRRGRLGDEPAGRTRRVGGVRRRAPAARHPCSLITLALPFFAPGPYLSFGRC